MNSIKKLICFQLFILSFFINIKAKGDTQQRIITLTSLSSDLVNEISPESLIGVSGSKIIKDNKINLPNLEIINTNYNGVDKQLGI